MTDDAARDTPASAESAPSVESAVPAERGAPPGRTSPAEPALSTAERLGEVVDRHLPYLLLAPALTLVVGLVAYPAAVAVKLSLYRVQLVNLDAQRFVGLANYAAVFADPVFGEVLVNTAVFVGASVVGQVGIGLGLALLLDRSRLGERVTRLYRLAFVLPWATTGVIVAYSWRFVFHPQVGLVNGGLRWLGVASPPAWLNSVEWAMVAVVVANVWRGVPFSLVFQTSGLRSIRPRLYEAADVGGASPLQAVRHVTLPLLWPFVGMNVVLVTLFTVNVFDVVYVMTGGGPLRATEVLSLHMYSVAFDEGAFGRANALAVVLLGVNAVVVAGYLALADRVGGGRR